MTTANTTTNTTTNRTTNTRTRDGRAELDRLRRRVAGRVTTPDDADHDEASGAWNRAHRHRPAVTVRAADVHDVVATLAYATASGRGLGIQATGHGGVVPVDGVLLLTGDLDDVEVDPVARTARVGAGATWAPVLAAAQEHGLAPLLGTSSGVGAVGYTLGGGIGWLARRHGTAADKVRSFEIATPDGRLLTASATERPELFRALRGGGGGAIGVVTAMEIDLVPVTEVYAGNLFVSVEATQAAAAAWVRWAEAAPVELTSSFVHMNHPPLPEIPDPLRGRSFAIVRGCWHGDLEEGRRYVDRLRDELHAVTDPALAPVLDTWDVIPFAAADSISRDPVDPLPCVTTGGWLTRFDHEVAATFADATFPVDGPPPVLLPEVRHLGGALAVHGADSVMAHRDGRFLFHVIGVPMVPGSDAEIEEHLERVRRRLGDAVADAAYLNFVDGAERRRRAPDAIAPEQRRRVADVHRWFDPDQVLRFGVPVPS